MKSNKIIIFSLCLIVVFSFHLVYAIDCIGPTPTGDDNYIHCENEDDRISDDGTDDRYAEDDGDEVAEISAEDNCQVTCTDPKDSSRTYTLKAYGTSTVIDDGTDKVGIAGTIEYYDSEGNTETLYSIDDYDYEGNERNEGIVAMFGYDVDDSILNNKGLDENYRKVITRAPSRIWPLFFSSVLDFKYGGTDSYQIFAYYNHKLDYTVCEDTYIELYLCADARTKLHHRLCPYTENTAFTMCIMHQNGKTSSIISVDSEGIYKE